MKNSYRKDTETDLEFRFRILYDYFTRGTY